MATLGALIVLIYYCRDHFHSYLKLGAVAESNVSQSYKPRTEKKVKVNITIRKCSCTRPIVSTYSGGQR